MLHLEKRVWDREKKKRKSEFDRACQKKTTVVYFIDMSLKIDKKNPLPQEAAEHAEIENDGTNQDPGRAA